MALTYSTMMDLGTTAPDFSLPDTVSGKTLALADLQSDVATVVTFICNHCPYVHHVNSKLVEIAKAYQAQGVQFVAISSNDVRSYPQDAPELMTQVAAREGYPFPYLFDESQEVARAYGAECTPDFFVFDAQLRCAYRGRFDETRPGSGKATGSDLGQALDALIAGHPVPPDQAPSMGCSIKWK
ncbi:MAG TPA: thioredoxin family protein [Cytophagales bacterium]|nr:thioredoxin family protein [Cytophagales bacterium]HAP59412.1 thioredoxin family protein [Cytophagales bacterium]